MASDQSETALGPKFHGVNALQALLKGVPYLGASLEQFMFGPLVELRIRRFEQTLREVAEQVHKLHTENAVSSERFVNLLETVAPAFTRSPDEFKRQRFRDLLIRASNIPAQSSDWANAELAGELLTSLAEPALRIVGGLHRLGEGGPWALVSQPVSQIVPQKEFDWDAPRLFGATIDYDWILVEQHARHLRELRLIWYNSHDARGGFGGLSLAPLGQFLVAWTIRSEDVDGQGVDVETPRVG